MTTWKQASSNDKATKIEARYREGSEPKHCGICKMFRGPHQCAAVQGTIVWTALCDYFEHD